MVLQLFWPLIFYFVTTNKKPINLYLIFVLRTSLYFQIVAIGDLFFLFFYNIFSKKVIDFYKLCVLLKDETVYMILNFVFFLTIDYFMYMTFTSFEVHI